MRKALKWIRDRYGNSDVFIFENGVPDLPDEGLHDQFRINYLTQYINNVLKGT